MKRNSFIFTSLIILFMLFQLTGCSKRFETGIKIEQVMLKNIQTGKTTKNELFKLLGLPKAIAVWNRPMYLYQPRIYTGETGLHADRIAQLQAEPFYEVFKTRNKLKDVHRVYYYYYAICKSSPGAKVTLEQDRLWVLMNEESEIVEDIYFMPRRK